MNTLRPAQGAKRTVKRVGRGNSSGKGTTAGRGTKGQAARTGGRNRRALRGLRPVLLQTPKLRGFKSLTRKSATVSLGQLNAEFAKDNEVTPKALVKKGLVPAGGGVKILAGGKLTKPLTVSGCKVSEEAKKMIEAAGGKVVQGTGKASRKA